MSADVLLKVIALQLNPSRSATCHVSRHLSCRSDAVRAGLAHEGPRTCGLCPNVTAGSHYRLFLAAEDLEGSRGWRRANNLQADVTQVSSPIGRGPASLRPMGARGQRALLIHRDLANDKVAVLSSCGFRAVRESQKAFLLRGLSCKARGCERCYLCVARPGIRRAWLHHASFCWRR